MIATVLLLLVTVSVGSLSASTDESSVIVESPTLYINRTPQRRSKLAHLDARPQVPDAAFNNNSNNNGDVEVSELLFDENPQNVTFIELAMTPGNKEFYLVLLVSVLTVIACIATVVLWWLCCRPKPVPRRFNPRYDGPPPKRLSKLSFRAFRYSMTGNQQLRSNRYRATEPQMEPAQVVSTVSMTSNHLDNTN